MVNPIETKNSFFSQDYVIRPNQVSYSFKYNLYRKMFFKLLQYLNSNDQFQIRKIQTYDFNITKVGNKYYGIDHITANVINIYNFILNIYIQDP